MHWEKLWLNYHRKEKYCSKKYLEHLCYNKNGYIICNAIEELSSAVQEMFGFTPFCHKAPFEEAYINLQLEGARSDLGKEGYQIIQSDGQVRIISGGEAGILYGVFDLIRCIMKDSSLEGMDKIVKPSNPLRMINHWDDIDGDIERGYSGHSFFFKDGEILINERTRDYARLMASVGINATIINNVNVKGEANLLITDRYLDKIAEMAEIFEGYGIKLYLCVDFASPMTVGGLDTADPLEGKVIDWWESVIANIYDKVKVFGGILVKADSEGRPGPFTYGRTHAEGANMLAKILKHYEGILIWRCFVYNCKQDWRDYKTDRAKAAYDNFMPLDGQFDDNVILQIKNGPMDFQVREPVSPLFGGLKKTNMMLEVQIAQEYTGHQIDVCYMVPMWKEVLDYHTYNGEEKDTVSDLVSGRTFGNCLCGMAAVSNTGDDPNWTGSDLAAANLFGYGRLAFDTSLSSEEIAAEWASLTFGNDVDVIAAVQKILMASWPAYENYTSPLGIGWMITPGTHYGPNIDGYEYDEWGTYHRANHYGIGVDRSHNGTRYAQQYNGPNAQAYDDPNKCPQELILFFHHLPYDFRLPSGKTVIQHIYDTHFEGVEMVENMINSWKSLQGKVPQMVYLRVLERFERQYKNARNWRDVVNTYFYRKSAIEDEKKRTIYM